MKRFQLVYFSRCFVISSFINASRILPTTEVRHTGLLIPSSFSKPFSFRPGLYFLLCSPLMSSLSQRSYDKISIIEPVIFSVILLKIPQYIPSSIMKFLTSSEFNLHKTYSDMKLSCPRNFTSFSFMNTEEKNKQSYRELDFAIKTNGVYAINSHDGGW